MEQQCTRGKVPSIFIAIPMEPWYTIPVEKTKRRRDDHGSHQRDRTGGLALVLGDKEPMIGNEEEDVTYPEFHLLADGGLLFVYRSGASDRKSVV